MRNLPTLLSRFTALRTLVVGDVMLDRFLWGNVSRISPEAPVPVVHVQRESAYPGGAANVARNLIPFSPQVTLLGATGADEHAHQLREVLAENGIRQDGLFEFEDCTTIVKTRVIARQQQIVRVDRERPCPLASAHLDEAIQFIHGVAPRVDAIILEDYGKGFVQQPLVDAAAECARRHQLVLTADPNPHNQLQWNGVTVLKPNRHEAFRMAGQTEPDPAAHPLDDQPLLDVGTSLLERWTTQMVLITLSQHGMILFRRDHPPAHIPAETREVFDVSGAGDTAIAVLTLALAANADPLDAVRLSNCASGIVVGKLGTATLTPEELRQVLIP